MTDKRILLIVNPRSGKRRGLAVLEQVKPVFAAADMELDVRVTEQSGHARQIAQEFNLAGDNVVNCLAVRQHQPLEFFRNINVRGWGYPSAPARGRSAENWNDYARRVFLPIGLPAPGEAARRSSG